MQRPTIAPAVLDAPDSATYIGRSKATIYRLVKAGELVALDDGLAGVRFRVADLDAWLDRCAARATK